MAAAAPAAVRRGRRPWLRALVGLGLVDAAITALGALGLPLPVGSAVAASAAVASPEVGAALGLLVVGLAAHVAVAVALVRRSHDLGVVPWTSTSVLLDGVVVAVAVSDGSWGPERLLLAAGLVHLAVLAVAVQTVREHRGDPPRRHLGTDPQRRRARAAWRPDSYSVLRPGRPGHLTGRAAVPRLRRRASFREPSEPLQRRA